jgi:uncharacterized membrane protein YedE/YeeE
MADHDSHPLFIPAVFIGGLVFGLGLAISEMARPEVVLNFLQFDDLGLLLVMGGAAVVTATGYTIFGRLGGRAPLSGQEYKRRLKSFDSNVLLGGTVFGVGWGLSGICPGAAYASLGIGNITILWAIGGMFVGAYLQGWLRDVVSTSNSLTTSPEVSD